MRHRNEYYPVSDMMWKAGKAIEQIADDKEREDLISAIYADHGNLDCFLPHAPLNEPEGVREYLNIPVKQRANITNPEVHVIRVYLAKRDQRTRDDISSRRFLQEVLIPSYIRSGRDDLVTKCQEILDEHGVMTMAQAEKYLERNKPKQKQMDWDEIAKKVE